MYAADEDDEDYRCEGGSGSCAPSRGWQGRGICVQIERVDYKNMLLNWAKTELLKEKVKAKLDQKFGKELDELAASLVEVMTEEKEQTQKMVGKKEGVKKKLKAFMENGEVI